MLNSSSMKDLKVFLLFFSYCKNLLVSDKIGILEVAQIMNFSYAK